MPKETLTSKNTRPVRNTEQKKKSEKLHDYQGVKDALREHQQKQIEKSSAHLTAFHEQKKSLYAHARRTAKDTSASGIIYIEEMQTNYRQLREQEKSFKSLVEDYTRLKRHQEEAFETLPRLCGKLVHELSLRRTSQVNAASETVSDALTSRQEVVKSGLKRARKELERIREEEKITSDATEMINYYKDLLRAASSDV